MAGIQLTSPGPFNFKAPDEWPRWYQRFQQLHVVSGLSEVSDAKQVSTFLYCMGEVAEAVLAATHATVDDRKTQAAVKSNSSSKSGATLSSGGHGSIEETSSQGKPPSSTSWHSTVLQLNYEYGMLKSEMIRDRRRDP